MGKSDPDNAAEIAQKIAEILRITKLTQTRFAKAVGTTQSTVSKWLALTQSPGVSQWGKVERFAMRDERLRHLFLHDLIARLLPDNASSDTKKDVHAIVEDVYRRKHSD